MGACCGRKSDPAEEQIRSILKDPKFKVNSITYVDFFNKMCDIRGQNQMISRKMIEKLLISTGYFYETISNSNVLYHKEIVKHVTNDLLEEENNLYEVIFYFYSLLNHGEDDGIDDLYDVLLFMNEGTLMYDTLRECIKKYFEFNTKQITTVIMNETTDLNIKSHCKDLISNIYNDSNIESQVLKMIEGLIPSPKATSQVDKNKFLNHFKNKPFASYLDIRDKFLSEYETK